MTGLAEAIRYHAAALDATRPQPRFAVVESFDATRHLAKVSIQPEGVLSGWLPILGMGGGGGWGLICPPAIGAQVVIVPLDGDHESWAVLGAAWSVVNQPAAPQAYVKSGEMALVSSAGAYIRLSSDGSATLYTPGNTTLNAAGNTTIEATGNVLVNAGGNTTVEAAGNVTVEATGTISLSAPNVSGGNGGTLFELCTSEVWTYVVGHVHNDAQGGLTSAPVTVGPTNPLTANLKGS